MDKEYIKNILWKDNFVRECQRDLVKNSVGCFDQEYLGRNPEKPYQDNVFISLIRMLTSYMINCMFDKIIDRVILIIKEEKDSEESHG